MQVGVTVLPVVMDLQADMDLPEVTVLRVDMDRRVGTALATVHREVLPVDPQVCTPRVMLLATDRQAAMLGQFDEC